MMLKIYYKKYLFLILKKELKMKIMKFSITNSIKVVFKSRYKY